MKIKTLLFFLLMTGAVAHSDSELSSTPAQLVPTEEVQVSDYVYNYPWLKIEKDLDSVAKDSLDAYQGSIGYDDKVIAQLLDIPYEQRQYIFPMFFEQPIVFSKKVLTHPDIIVWRGKIPERIAPKLKNLTVEDLKYLPARYYPFLAPEAFFDSQETISPIKEIENKEIK